MSLIDSYRPFNGRGLCDDDAVFNVVNSERAQLVNISRGLDPDKIAVTAFGERTSTVAESRTPIWPDGAIKDAGPGGIQLYVRSTSALDVLGSTGIASLSVHYINGDGDEIEQTIAMNGITRVPLTVFGRFVQDMHIALPSQGYAKGNIYVDDGTDPNVYGQMGIGESRSLSSFRMVPRGYRLFIDDAVASSSSVTSDTTTKIRLASNSINGNVFRDPILFVPFASTGIQNNGIAGSFRTPIPLKEYAIVGGLHTSDKDATISMSWWGRFERV